ncbi:molybdate ABC transporter substrate-binding protein [Neobacillus thermocopriae]|uniref:molybdate ABC transporter substrate-binding protein n=1 Tax=Neobacillus thermocopriae TaxID=1215031 RepID=UPI00376FAE12
MKRKYSNYLFYLFILLLIIMSGCSSSDNVSEQEEQKLQGVEEKVELTVSAAASLQNALNEIKEKYTNEHPNVKINYNFGASGALQQQISQGAPVDIFLSAAEDKFELLIEQGLIDKKKSMDLVGNEIVLVVPKEATSIKTFKDLTKAEKISIGTPESVPAGKYAKETLEKMDIWPAVEGKIVYAKDVRQVLTYVETNNVDAGIVYKTDAFISDKVKIVTTADEKSHSPIIYPLGVIKNSLHAKEAQQFYEYLQCETSIIILEKYGFKKLN